MPGQSPAAYDVVVVGAGPAGATVAYDLARGGDGVPPRRVALLDKATFPRDKFCGDAWCAPALEILEEMGVLPALEAEGLVRPTRSGGFVSPNGESFVSTGEAPPARESRVYSIRRSICDERIARRAAEVGAALHEGASVAATELAGDGTWTVHCHDGRAFRGALLVAADGATSRIARKLGVVAGGPEATASRRYVAAGTHAFRADGVLLYPTYVLPGYVALFRHHDDVVDLGSYLIPGGAAAPGELRRLYAERIESDPFVRAALGPRAEFLEPLRIGPLRLGGVPRSVGERLVVVGDAAGQTDPLTGEGIHTAMIAARLAARTIHEAFARGDLSERALGAYHTAWTKAFGRDFAVSAAAGRLIHRMPLLLDAANRVAQRKGDAFMARFGAAMTGVVSKAEFVRPAMAAPLAAASLGELVRQRLLRHEVAGPASYAAAAAAHDPRATTFRNAGVRT
ncbi:MAG: NAD(P)/FAD-dependent oxidoreductase [Deltaproteobacteria bacterium]|nr:NAD(P)/FAD-dependent oxidoreductase [Deltaproteobacteria bacterium]